MSFVTFMALSYAINKENYKAKVNILINTIKSIFSSNKLSVDSFQTKKWTKNYSFKTNKHGYKILTEEPDVPTWTTNSGKSSSRGNKRKIFDEDSYFDNDNDPPPPPGSAYDSFNPTGGGSASNDQGKSK